MPRALIKSRLHFNKQKLKIKQEVNNTESNLPHLNKNYYQEMASLYNRIRVSILFLYLTNEIRSFPIDR